MPYTPSGCLSAFARSVGWGAEMADIWQLFEQLCEVARWVAVDYAEEHTSGTFHKAPGEISCPKCRIIRQARRVLGVGGVANHV